MTLFIKKERSGVRARYPQGKSHGGRVTATLYFLFKNETGGRSFCVRKFGTHGDGPFVFESLGTYGDGPFAFAIYRTQKDRPRVFLFSCPEPGMAGIFSSGNLFIPALIYQ